MRSLFKTIAILTGAAVFGLSVALLVSYAQAPVYWSAPSANAPASNLHGLLNASVSPQTKLGGLLLDRLVVNGGYSFLGGPTYINNSNPIFNALTVYGRVQVSDGTQAPGKVFIASNNSGLGSWVSLNCGLNGSGQQMFLAGINSNGTPNCVNP